MQLERLRPTTYSLKLSTYELAALISAARWVADGADGELPEEAEEHLSQIVADYDSESERIAEMETKS